MSGTPASESEKTISSRSGRTSDRSINPEHANSAAPVLGSASPASWWTRSAGMCLRRVRSGRARHSRSCCRSEASFAPTIQRASSTKFRRHRPSSVDTHPLQGRLNQRPEALGAFAFPRYPPPASPSSMFDTNTRTIVVVGAQWGDEGKGKLVDVLAERADWVVRYQGGANAGHTVHIGEKSFVLHQIPSGILHPGVRCAIGNGVVLDVETLFAEIDGLVSDGVDVEGRLYVSDRAHLVLPYHKLVDAESEASKAIGTTGRGIGPAYEDKVARRGVRVLDLRHGQRLRQLVEQGAAHAEAQLTRFGSSKRVSCAETIAMLERLAERLLPLADDIGLAMHRAVRSGAAVLLEGAQGSLLDIDHGTY